jgi:hypothetical protein
MRLSVLLAIVGAVIFVNGIDAYHEHADEADVDVIVPEHHTGMHDSKHLIDVSEENMPDDIVAENTVYDDSAHQPKTPDLLQTAATSGRIPDAGAPMKQAEGSPDPGAVVPEQPLEKKKRGKQIIKPKLEKKKKKKTPDATFAEEATAKKPANLCRGYKMGMKYPYRHFVNMGIQNQNTNVDNSGKPHSQSTAQGLGIDVLLSITPLASEVYDGSPEKLFRMTVEAVDVKNKKEKKLDDNPNNVPDDQNQDFVPKMMPPQEEVYKTFSEPFYFRQNCKLEITKVYHPRDEKPSIVGMKKSIASAFSHSTLDVKTLKKKSKIRGVTFGFGKVKRTLAYETEQRGLQGTYKKRYINTVPEKNGHAVYHTSMIQLHEADTKPMEATADDHKGVINVNVGELSMNGGEVDHYKSRSVGGLLTRSKAKNDAQLVSMLQLDSSLSLKGSPSVRAQSAQDSTSQTMKNGKEVFIGYETQFEGYSKRPTEVLSTHHKRPFIETTLVATQEELEGLRRGTAVYSEEKLRHALQLLSKPIEGTPRLKLVHWLQDEINLHPKAAAKTIAACLRRENDDCSERRTRITVLNLLSRAGAPQDNILSMLKSSDVNDQFAALTASAQLKKPEARLMLATKAICDKSSNSTMANAALLALGTLISRNPDGALEHTLVEKVVKSKTYDQELVVAFIHNADLVNAADLLESGVNSDDIGVQVSAISSLKGLKGPKAEDLLLRAYENDKAKPVVQFTALKAMTDMAFSEAASHRIVKATLKHIHRVTRTNYRRTLLAHAELLFRARHRIITGKDPTQLSVRTEKSLHTQALLAVTANANPDACDLKTAIPCGLDKFLDKQNLIKAQQGMKALCDKMKARQCLMPKMPEPTYERLPDGTFKVLAQIEMYYMQGVLNNVKIANTVGTFSENALIASATALYNATSKRMNVQFAYKKGSDTINLAAGPIVPEIKLPVPFVLKAATMSHDWDPTTIGGNVSGAATAIMGSLAIGDDISVEATMLAVNKRDYALIAMANLTKTHILAAFDKLGGLGEGMVSSLIDKSATDGKITNWGKDKNGTLPFGLVLGARSSLATGMFMLKNQIPEVVFQDMSKSSKTSSANKTSSKSASTTPAPTPPAVVNTSNASSNSGAAPQPVTKSVPKTPAERMLENVLTWRDEIVAQIKQESAVKTHANIPGVVKDGEISGAKTRELAKDTAKSTTDSDDGLPDKITFDCTDVSSFSMKGYLNHKKQELMPYIISAVKDVAAKLVSDWVGPCDASSGVGVACVAFQNLQYKKIEPENGPPTYQLLTSFDIASMFGQPANIKLTASFEANTTGCDEQTPADEKAAKAQCEGAAAVYFQEQADYSTKATDMTMLQAFGNPPAVGSSCDIGTALGTGQCCDKGTHKVTTGPQQLSYRWCKNPSPTPTPSAPAPTAPVPTPPAEEDPAQAPQAQSSPEEPTEGATCHTNMTKCEQFVSIATRTKITATTNITFNPLGVEGLTVAPKEITLSGKGIRMTGEASYTALDAKTTILADLNIVWFPWDDAQICLNLDVTTSIAAIIRAVAKWFGYDELPLPEGETSSVLNKDRKFRMEFCTRPAYRKWGVWFQSEAGQALWNQLKSPQANFGAVRAIVKAAKANGGLAVTGNLYTDLKNSLSRASGEEASPYQAACGNAKSSTWNEILVMMSDCPLNGGCPAQFSLKEESAIKRLTDVLYRRRLQYTSYRVDKWEKSDTSAHKWKLFFAKTGNNGLVTGVMNMAATLKATGYQKLTAASQKSVQDLLVAIKAQAGAWGFTKDYLQAGGVPFQFRTGLPPVEAYTSQLVALLHKVLPAARWAAWLVTKANADAWKGLMADPLKTVHMKALMDLLRKDKTLYAELKSVINADLTIKDDWNICCEADDTTANAAPAPKELKPAVSEFVLSFLETQFTKFTAMPLAKFTAEDGPALSGYKYQLGGYKVPRFDSAKGYLDRMVRKMKAKLNAAGGFMSKLGIDVNLLTTGDDLSTEAAKTKSLVLAGSNLALPSEDLALGGDATATPTVSNKTATKPYWVPFDPVDMMCELITAGAMALCEKLFDKCPLDSLSIKRDKAVDLSSTYTLTAKVNTTVNSKEFTGDITAKLNTQTYAVFLEASSSTFKLSNAFGIEGLHISKPHFNVSYHNSTCNISVGATATIGTLDAVDINLNFQKTPNSTSRWPRLTRFQLSSKTSGNKIISAFATLVGYDGDLSFKWLKETHDFYLSVTFPQDFEGPSITGPKEGTANTTEAKDALANGATSVDVCDGGTATMKSDECCDSTTKTVTKGEQNLNDRWCKSTALVKVKSNLTLYQKAQCMVQKAQWKVAQLRKKYQIVLLMDGKPFVPLPEWVTKIINEIKDRLNKVLAWVGLSNTTYDSKMVNGTKKYTIGAKLKASFTFLGTDFDLNMQLSAYKHGTELGIEGKGKVALDNMFGIKGFNAELSSFKVVRTKMLNESVAAQEAVTTPSQLIALTKPHSMRGRVGRMAHKVVRGPQRYDIQNLIAVHHGMEMGLIQADPVESEEEDTFTCDLGKNSTPGAYVTKYSVQFSGALQLSYKMPKVYINYDYTDSKFTAAQLKSKASIKDIIYGLAGMFGLGEPKVILMLAAKPGTEDIVHDWRVDISPSKDPAKKMPKFQIYQDNKKFSLVPWFIQWLQDKAEELCAKVLGKCELSHFTAQRLSGNQTAEDDAKKKLRGSFMLGMDVSTAVAENPVVVHLELKYDADNSDYSVSGTSNSTIKNLFGVGGLALSPQYLNYSSSKGVSWGCKVSFKDFVNATATFTGSLGSGMDMDMRLEVSEKKIVENLMKVIGLDISLGFLFSSKIAKWQVIFSAHPKGCNSATVLQLQQQGILGTLYKDPEQVDYEMALMQRDQATMLTQVATTGACSTDRTVPRSKQKWDYHIDILRNGEPFSFIPNFLRIIKKFAVKQCKKLVDETCDFSQFSFNGNKTTGLYGFIVEMTWLDNHKKNATFLAEGHYNKANNTYSVGLSMNKTVTPLFGIDGFAMSDLSVKGQVQLGADGGFGNSDSYIGVTANFIIGYARRIPSP